MSTGSVTKPIRSQSAGDDNDDNDNDGESSMPLVPDEWIHVTEGTSNLAENENDHLDVAQKDSTASVLGSSGLSELSRQLRVLQAKNEGQSMEIDRLERQLRILADLQGVSVRDLRSALESACDTEALGEWKARVKALEAQLEAAQLQSISSQATSFDQNAKAHQMAQLELRVGQLEEVELTQQQEIQNLYAQLLEERALTARLQTTNAQQQKTMRLGLKQIKDSKKTSSSPRKTSSRKKSAMQTSGIVDLKTEVRRMTKDADEVLQSIRKEESSSPPRKPSLDDDDDDDDDEMKEELEHLQTVSDELAKDLDESSSHFEDAQQSLYLAQMELKVQQEKVVVLEQQQANLEETFKLKQAQLRARSMVQDERIQDLEQQLSSLYTAFELYRQERTEEQEEMEALQTFLRDADQQVAQQVSDSQNNGATRPDSSRGNVQSTPSTVEEEKVEEDASVWQDESGFHESTPFSQSLRVSSPPPSRNPGSSSFDDSIPPPTSPEWARPSTSPFEVQSTRQPSSSSSMTAGQSRRELSPFALSAIAAASSPNLNATTPSTLSQTSPSASFTSNETGSRVILMGELQTFHPKRLLNKWKKQRAILRFYPSLQYYQFTLGNKRYKLLFGISQVVPDSQHYVGFRLYLDPYNTANGATILHLAAMTVEDRDEWISALQLATRGVTSDEIDEEPVVNQIEDTWSSSGFVVSSDGTTPRGVQLD